MDDPKTIFQINAYVLAKKEAARLFRNKIFDKNARFGSFSGGD